MNRNAAAEFWANFLLFLTGAAGFVGIFLNWPIVLCIVLMAIGWGLIVIVNSDGGIDF